MLIDFILLLILVACLVSGYRRGLLMSFLSLVVLVICCLGGSMARQALEPRVAEALEPRVASVIADSMERRLQSGAEDALVGAEDTYITIGNQTVSFSDLMEMLGDGIPDSVLAEGTSSALESATEALAEAMAEIIVEKIAGILIFAVAFLILYLILHSLVTALNVVDRLPVIHTLNHAGGAVLGFLEGLLGIAVVTVIVGKAGLIPDGLGPLGSILAALAQRFL